MKRLVAPAGSIPVVFRPLYRAILVQKRLGHKTIEITLGVYGHLFDHDEQTSIDALADRLYGTTGG